MRLMHLLTALTITAALALTGCGGGDGDGHDHDHGHDHAGHDHDHGDHDHGHSHDPKHGGVLTEVGDHVAHIETKLDPETGTLTLWMMDGEAAKGVKSEEAEIPVTVYPKGKDAGGPINVALKPVANELTGDTAESSSQYAATDDRLKELKKFRIEIQTLFIKGQAHSMVSVTHPAEK